MQGFFAEVAHHVFSSTMAYLTPVFSVNPMLSDFIAYKNNYPTYHGSSNVFHSFLNFTTGFLMEKIYSDISGLLISSPQEQKYSMEQYIHLFHSLSNFADDEDHPKYAHVSSSDIIRLEYISLAALGFTLLFALRDNKMENLEAPSIRTKTYDMLFSYFTSHSG